MSSFLDLPDELILKVFSYTETVDLLRCGQVSKRIRTISNDNSLFQTVNLSNKYLKSDLVATILNKGFHTGQIKFGTKIPINKTGFD